MANCPRCGRQCTRMEDRLYRCETCKMLTDGIDDGDVGYGRQDRYAERKEEYLLRKKQREDEQANRRRRR
jgi:hypothetical protein